VGAVISPTLINPQKAVIIMVRNSCPLYALTSVDFEAEQSFSRRSSVIGSLVSMALLLNLVA
jgi:hypothetical protein